MSRDALFQLRMDSVLLNATQTEEILAKRVDLTRIAATDTAMTGRDFGVVALSVAGLFRAERKSRGNSAKALIESAFASAP
ncbi:hypothetical protein [Microvirga sp. M2]|uniref:hypothetical protein n=1 Tax=Microvirga sp. M2 TaxID=3073270 RepID=UPI0039C1A5B5